MRDRSRGPYLLALLVAWAAAGPATAQPAGPEIWVVNNTAGSITVVDPSSFSVVTTFDISDPDGDSTIDPPWDLCFSTASTQQGTHAFVTQGHLLTVIDVATRGIVAVHDIATDLGVPFIALRGCDAASSREFLPTVGPPVVRSYLHLAGTLATGNAHFVVVDQGLAISGATNPVVGSGLLATSATGQDVQVMDTPGGARFQRAWYSATRSGGVAGGDALLAVSVSKPVLLSSPWTVDDTITLPVLPPMTLPDLLHFGVPAGRELPVMTTGAFGRLDNLGTGGACAPGGDLRGVTLTGPGPNSYTALALDALSGEVVVLDPRNCSSLRYSVGADPTDVATLGRLDWREAYVVSRGADTLTRVENNGTVTTIPLGLPVAGPTAVGLTLKRLCVVKDIRVQRFDEDGDNDFDDFKLTWDTVGCPPGTKYEVNCFCTSTVAGCPCLPCDCSLPNPGAGCFCPGILAQMPPVPNPPALPLQVAVIDAEDPDVPIESPWKMLGIAAREQFVHALDDGAAGEWDYAVEPEDDP